MNNTELAELIKISANETNKKIDTVNKSHEKRIQDLEEETECLKNRQDTFMGCVKGASVVFGLVCTFIGFVVSHIIGYFK